MGVDVVRIVGVVLAGLLAGTEFVVRYGVQPALRTLEDRAHIEARVALVRRLRVVVPVLMVPAVVVGVVVLVTGLHGDAAGSRWGGVVGLVAFLLFAFLGTVPINIKVIEWRSEAPPADWRETVRRWERLDVFRSSAAIIAFICFTAALA